MQFWPEDKYSTNNGMSIRNPLLDDFTIIFIKFKSRIDIEKQMKHTHKLIEAKFPRKRGVKNKEKREIMRPLVLKSFFCVSFSSCSSLAKSCHKVLM